MDPSNGMMNPALLKTDANSHSVGQDQIPKHLPGENSSSSQNQNVSKLEKSSDVKVPYTEPVWSCLPPSNYGLEVIKSGTVITDVPVNAAYITFGRLQTCDVVLEHPSISRHHAVLQYCPGDESRVKGFYIYDLGSTHGTFLNKNKIVPKIYYKLEVGHIIKFGGSTRLHIFHGPEEDMNEENSACAKVEEQEAEMCNWGIGEDADEEEDLTVNPFALSTANEELYLDDPKKTLRGWFEREGYELEYDVEEKGFRTFVCRVQLPIGGSIDEYPFAEASVAGKKKEAVVACAMEACRILDRHGLLRQAHHENRKKKQKNWEDEDFYDSDEDTYLDRTGTIERKREIRKKMVKKAEADTFQSLTTKLELVNTEISEVENRLHDSFANLDSDVDDEKDSLESYMSQIKGLSNVCIDKVTKSKLKLKHSELLKEKSRLEELLDVARPTALPPIVKTVGILRKRPAKKFQFSAVAKPNDSNKHETEEIEEEEEEEESDDDDNKDTLNQPKLPRIEFPVKTIGGMIVKDESKTGEFFEENLEKSKIIISENTTLVDGSGNVKNILRNNTDAKVKVAKPVSKTDVYNSDSDYSMWVPPKNQTGDGTTHLNAKYGY